MRRVVITGLGLVGPLGVGARFSWNRLLEGVSGVGPITLFDASALPSKIAGEIPRSQEVNAASQGKLNFDEWITPGDRRKLADFVSYGVIAADMALQDAGWAPTDIEELERTGVLIGSGIGGLETIYDASLILRDKGHRRVNPFFIPSSLINISSGVTSIRHGFRGPNHSVVTACATGAHAIGDASRFIMFGDADVMVAGGSEGSICALGISAFTALRALSTNFNDTPQKASRPWDQDRDGFVMGEGGAVLILEELEHAKKRGAKIYAEIVGYGLSGDAYHITATSPDGNGGYRAMKSALNHAKLNPDDVDYINAHGTSTPLGDVSEIQGFLTLMKDTDLKTSMSSTKSSTGHLLGAAGGAEAIFSILSIQDQVVPPTLNLENPVPEAKGIDLVPLVAKERKVDVAMSNSFGFGGTNASLVFKKYTA